MRGPASGREDAKPDFARGLPHKAFLGALGLGDQVVWNRTEGLTPALRGAPRRVLSVKC